MNKRNTNIYMTVKNHLPEWLNDEIVYSHPEFITWCQDNQEVLTLILDDLLVEEKRNIDITLDSLQGETNTDVGKKYDISSCTARKIKNNVLGKVLNTLKKINKMSFKQMHNVQPELPDDSIKQLDLPTRIYNILNKNDLRTVSQLKKATYRQLKNVPLLGESGINAIEQKLRIKFDRTAKFDFNLKEDIQIEYIKEKILELHQEIFDSYNIIAKSTFPLDAEFLNKFNQNQAVFEVLAIATNIPVPPFDYWNSVEYITKLQFSRMYNSEYNRHQAIIYTVTAWMDRFFRV